MTAPDGRSDPDTRLAAEIERLRLRMETGPPLTDAELRRRVDLIADAFLALYGAGDSAQDLSVVPHPVGSADSTSPSRER